MRRSWHIPLYDSCFWKESGGLPMRSLFLVLFSFRLCQSDYLSVNKLYLILQLWWSLGVEDLWLLPFFPTSRLLGAGQSICQGVHHQHYGPTFISIWGSGPLISDLTSSPLCAPVRSFLDALTGESGPTVTGTPKIWSHSLLILAWGNTAEGVKCHYHAIVLIQCLKDVIQGSALA